MQTTTEDGLPPAGWYRDGSAPGFERWWNGRAWTDRSRLIDANSTPPSPPIRQYPMQAVSCRRCGSGDLKTLQAIREQGTALSRGTSSGWVQDSNGQGHSVTMSTSSVSYTEAARAAAPPKRRSSAWALLAGGPLLILIFGYPAWDLGANGYGTVMVDLGLLLIVGIALTLIGAVLLPGERACNAEVFPVELHRWSNSWRCQRCGTVTVA